MDIEITKVGSAVIHLTAMNARAAAFLQMMIDREDEPTLDAYGRAFMVIRSEDLEHYRSKAILAGLSSRSLRICGS